jgi:hypothetical protein
MTSYSELSQNPSKFLALTGYTLEEFQALLPHFRSQFEDYVAAKTLNAKARLKRRYTDYHNSPLPNIEDKLLFILIYLKQGTTQEMHATLFGMHQPDANRWIHLLHPILNRTLAKLDELPAREAEALELAGDELKVYFHDGTERPIPRPTDQEVQKQYYSGKKKQHTIKNIVIINALCKIIFLTVTCEGKKHDKKAADEADYSLPEGSRLLQDTGFQGFAMAGVSIIQPKKKPRGRDLSPEDKESNRLISQLESGSSMPLGGSNAIELLRTRSGIGKRTFAIRLWKRAADYTTLD